MKRPGQVVLFQFPKTDLINGKLRPALLLGKLPGNYGDILICMISSQIHQAVESFDEIINSKDDDFSSSGLKVDSVVRIGRLAVVQDEILVGSIGEISQKRLLRIKNNLSDWLVSDE